MTTKNETVVEFLEHTKTYKKGNFDKLIKTPLITDISVSPDKVVEITLESIFKTVTLVASFAAGTALVSKEQFTQSFTSERVEKIVPTIDDYINDDVFTAYENANKLGFDTLNKFKKVSLLEKLATKETQQKAAKELFYHLLEFSVSREELPSITVSVEDTEFRAKFTTLTAFFPAMYLDEDDVKSEFLEGTDFLSMLRQGKLPEALPLMLKGNNIQVITPDYAESVTVEYTFMDDPAIYLTLKVEESYIYMRLETK